MKWLKFLIIWKSSSKHHLNMTVVMKVKSWIVIKPSKMQKMLKIIRLCRMQLKIHYQKWWCSVVSRTPNGWQPANNPEQYTTATNDEPSSNNPGKWSLFFFQANIQEMNATKNILEILCLVENGTTENTSKEQIASGGADLNDILPATWTGRLGFESRKNMASHVFIHLFRNFYSQFAILSYLG